MIDSYSPDREVASVDYETHYSNEYSVAKMSYWHYCHDPRFRAYRVSIVTSLGFKWVGDPRMAPWDRIKDCNWVSHNKPFDYSVHLRCQELGQVPAWLPPYWGNTANLCAWIRVPRSLFNAVRVLYGVLLKKDIRDVAMKGKQWEEYPKDLQDKIDAYAIADGEWCLRIWTDHIASWPTKERRLADLIDERGLRGMYCDRAGMERDIELLEKVIFHARSRIPWADDPDEKILSHPACTKECRKLGIPAPASLAMDDEGLQEWEDTYGEKHSFVAAMRDYRRANSLLKKYRTIQSRIKDDGRFEFSVSYLGTHTGRTSGTDKAEQRKGANMLNMPRDPLYVRDDFSVVSRKNEMRDIASYRKKHKGALPPGIAHDIYLRSKIIPAPGFKFVICDKAQIEARITNWFAKDEKTLALIRSGLSVYESHAISLMGYVPKPGGDGLKKDDPQKYALAKARELALGFQAGHIKFIEMAKLYIDEEDIEKIFQRPVSKSETNLYLDYLDATMQKDLRKEFDAGDERLRRARVNSWLQVEQFRNAKKDTLVALWKKLDNELRISASYAKGGNSALHEIELPSGRILKYFDVREVDGSIRAKVERGSDIEKYFYGGKCLENAVQATARDVFMEDQLNLDAAGIQVVLDIYDEVVTEVPLDFDENYVLEIMTRVPAWATGLPIGAEVETSMYYKK